MGTRSTVKFYESYGDNPCICAIYNQCDGYLSGVGYELANWLLTKTLINGFNSSHNFKDHANGMGCLAAQYIAVHKNGLGALYMTTSDDKQEYNYEVREIDGKIQIKVDDIFTGTPQELLDFKEVEEENEI